MIHPTRPSPPRFQGLQLGILFQDLNFNSPRHYGITLIGESLPGLKSGEIKLNGQPLGQSKAVARLSHDLAKGHTEQVARRINQVVQQAIAQIQIPKLGKAKMFGWEAQQLKSVQTLFSESKQAFLDMIAQAQPKSTIVRDEQGKPVLHMMYLGTGQWVPLKTQD